MTTYSDNIGIRANPIITVENGWVLDKNKEHPAEINETNFDDMVVLKKLKIIIWFCAIKTLLLFETIFS
jgi:hypothetical protein